jgi:hypothetical protein
MRFFNTLLAILIFSILLLPIESFSIDPYKFKTDTKSYWIVMDKMSWPEAAEYAVENGGYLAAINSEDEQEAIFDAIVNGAKIRTDYTSVYDGGGVAYLWIGASDQQSEGVWLWDGDNDGVGDNFWNGQGMGGDGTGKPVNNAYWNWGGKSSSVAMEPDNFNGNQNSAAIALEPWPKNMGLMGDTGEWNDIASSNKVYFVVEFDFADVPEKCELPQGDELVCDKDQDSDYQVPVVDSATEYVWSLSPENAGTIDGSTESATINWDQNFNGIAEITVYAKNPLGEGEVSDPLTVIVNSYPDFPSDISGDEQLCKDPENSTYMIDQIEYADSYVWSIAPEDAGIITGDFESAVVDWNENFTGEAIIAVAGVNDCGEGQASEFFILIIASPDKPETPTGETDLDKNPQNTTYSIPSMDYVNEYIWVLTPENAGEVIEEMNVATVDWNDDFSGEATLSVAGVNDCGEGEFSDELLITVKDDNIGVFEAKNGVSLYPNPCTEKCVLSISNEFMGKEIRIMNSLGVILNSSEMIHVLEDGSSYQINVEILSQGTYFVIIDKNVIPMVVTK